MKTFLKRQKPGQDLALQITSMADIFMILLVFLLKNYSNSITSISPSHGAKLPVANSQKPLEDTLKLEIATDSILIDEKPVMKLTNFEINPNSLNASGRIESLDKVLTEERKKIPFPNMSSNLMVMADERTPYATIKTVLGSAAMAGFVDLQLVVVQAQD